MKHLKIILNLIHEKIQDFHIYKYTKRKNHVKLILIKNKKTNFSD